MPSRPAKEPNRNGLTTPTSKDFQKDPTGSFKGLNTRDHLIFGNKRECCGSYPKELSLLDSLNCTLEDEFDFNI